MTDASLPAGRFTEGDFRVGQVFSRAWSVFSGHFLKFMLVTGIASLPALLLPQPQPGNPANPLPNPGWFAFGLFFMIVLGVLSQAIVLHGAFQVMRGRPANLVESASVGLRRLFPIIVATIIMIILVFLASLLLFFPGMMLYMMWFVAVPACVVERLGPIQCLRRSRELTKGHRWRIFGLVLVTLIPALILGAILVAVVVAIMGMGVVLGLTPALSATVAQVVGLIWSAIWKAFYSIVVVVTYHDLRVAKEGVDTEQIAAVFE